MAFSFPAKESVGALLMYLIVGDIAAILYYRKSADRVELKKLIIWIIVGILIGVFILSKVDDAMLKSILGVLVLLLVVGEIFRYRLKLTVGSNYLRIAAGIAAGVATAIGNAAGPIMAVYLLLTGLDKHGFMGTTALLFCIVNLIKLPAFVFLGMIQPAYFNTFLFTFPLVLIGAIIGRRFIERISSTAFNFLILLFTAVAGILLLLS